MRNWIFIFGLISTLLLGCKQSNKNEHSLIEVENAKYNPDAALSFFNDWLKKDPDDVEALTLRSKAYTQLGLNKLALEDAQKAWKNSDKDCEVFVLLLNCLIDTENLEQATQMIEQNEGIECDDHDFYFQKGFVYYHLNKFSLAMDYFNKSILKMPFQSETYLYRGLAYAKMKDTSMAIKNFNLTIQNDSSNPHAYECLLSFYSVQKNKEKFNEMLSLANFRKLSTPEILYHKATYFKQKELLDSANYLMNEVIKRSPNHALAHQHIGREAFLKNDKQLAEHHLQRAVRNGENNDMNKYLLSVVYLELGRFALADTLVSQLLSKDTSNVNYLKLKKELLAKNSN